MVKRRRTAKSTLTMYRKPKLMRSPVTKDTVHRFIRTVSTNDGGANTTNIQIRTNALGLPQYYAAGAAVSADNIQFVFSLSSFDVYFAGSLTSTQNVPGYTDFASLYDQWCIEKVELLAMPTFSQGGVVTGSSSNQLYWHIYAEDNDDNAATSVNQLQQYPGCKYTQFTNSGVHPQTLAVLHPKPAMAMYRSATGFSYGEPKGRQWIDMANTTTPHYGFKMALDNSYAGYGANTTVGCLNIVARIHFAFREPI